MVAPGREGGREGGWGRVDGEVDGGGRGREAAPWEEGEPGEGRREWRGGRKGMEVLERTEWGCGRKGWERE